MDKDQYVAEGLNSFIMEIGNENFGSPLVGQEDTFCRCFEPVSQRDLAEMLDTSKLLVSVWYQNNEMFNVSVFPYHPFDINGMADKISDEISEMFALSEDDAKKIAETENRKLNDVLKTLLPKLFGKRTHEVRRLCDHSMPDDMHWQLEFRTGSSLLDMLHWEDLRENLTNGPKP